LVFIVFIAKNPGPALVTEICTAKTAAHFADIPTGAVFVTHHTYYLKYFKL